MDAEEREGLIRRQEQYEQRPEERIVCGLGCLQRDALTQKKHMGERIG
jgi:hypothetical protein